MWNNADVKPVENSWEDDRRPEYWTYFGARKAHNVRISESSSNEHIKEIDDYKSSFELIQCKLFQQNRQKPIYWPIKS